LWGYGAGSRPNENAHSHASRLQRKLNRLPEIAYILKVWGVGYRLVATAD
jgi:DNA-binding response OmpR family regulator